MNPARWPVWGQLLLAFLAGALAVLGFAPFGLGLAALASLTLLFFLWRHPARPGLNVWTGYAFGLGLMGFGVSWIRISIAQFGGVPPALAALITLLFVLFMALYFALAGWLGERLRKGADGLWLVAVLPAVWVLVEWLRGWLFTGFPWLSLGYSQIDLPLAGYGPLLGVFGVSLVLAVSAGLLNLWPRLAGALVLLALWAGGLGLQQLQWSAARRRADQGKPAAGKYPADGQMATRQPRADPESVPRPDRLGAGQPDRDLARDGRAGTRHRGGIESFSHRWMACSVNRGAMSCWGSWQTAPVATTITTPC